MLGIVEEASIFLEYDMKLQVIKMLKIMPRKCFIFEFDVFLLSVIKLKCFDYLEVPTCMIVLTMNFSIAKNYFEGNL
jgi:hypothetical protein